MRLSICFYIKKDKSYKGIEDFLYVCCMKGFMRKIVVFLFATIFGLTSAIFLSAGGENELVKPQDPSYPYSLIDVRAQSLPIQNFTAIIPVERGLCVNVSRFPSSPITEEASGNAAFLYEQQLCCQLVDLREKIVGDCYDKYKAQLCYDGHFDLVE